MALVYLFVAKHFRISEDGALAETAKDYFEDCGAKAAKEFVSQWIDQQSERWAAEAKTAYKLIKKI